MFTIDALRDLYRHMAWADAQVWAAVTKLPAGPPDERLRTLLLHIHTVQTAFLHVWTGQPLVFREEREFESLQAVRDWAHPYYSEVTQFLETLDADRLAEPLELPWAKPLASRFGREPCTPTLGETIFQVTVHSTHHRAQVNTRLKELSAEPPFVDYIAWIWFGRPEPGPA